MTSSSSSLPPLRPGSQLSMLSPLQVEKASFTPRSLVQPVPNDTTKHPPLDSVVSSLAQRLEAQEDRLKELEAELKQHQTTCSVQVSPELSSPARHRPRCVEPVADLLSLDAEVSFPCTPASTGAKILTEQRTPRSSTASQSPLPSSANLTPRPGDSTSQGAMTDQTEDLPYQADSWEAFESHLNSAIRVPLISPKSNTPATSAGDPCETLLEGIGSVDELTLHQKGTDKLLQIGATGRTNTRPKPQPWDGTISWTMTSTFDDENEEFNASARQHCPKASLLGLFQHGLVFTPNESDDNVYRTVALINLPLKMRMKTLFKGIMGGEVFSAHLVNMERVAGFHMGVVTFVREEAAAAYAEFASKNGVYFNNQRAKVTLLKTGTYPMRKWMERCIFEEGHTRCLSVRGPTDPDRFTYILENIRTRLPMYFDLGDRMVEDDTETEVIVRLNSIKAAQDVMQILRNVPALATSDTDIDFAADPCAQPLPDSAKG